MRRFTSKKVLGDFEWSDPDEGKAFAFVPNPTMRYEVTHVPSSDKKILARQTYENEKFDLEQFFKNEFGVE